MKKSKISDIIFKELVKRGYSLEGKKRTWNIADSKLWYLTPEQARAFLDLEKYDDFQRAAAKKEIDLIEENCSEIIKSIEDKPVNIIDMGCGDGEKALAFVDCFKDKSKLRYCPIDVSEFMVKSAIGKLGSSNLNRIIKLKGNVFEFKDIGDVSSAVRKDDFNTNFILLLGGSLENSEIHELLYDIKLAMKPNDYLLIGNKITNVNPLEIIKSYDKNKYIDNLVIKTAIHLGLEKEDVEYSARFKGSRVEMLYTLKKDKTIKSGNKKVEFKAGDKIISIISYKYNQNKLMKNLKMYFDDVKLYSPKDNSYALALCRK